MSSSRPLLFEFQSALHSFSQSSSTFRVLRSISSHTHNGASSFPSTPHSPPSALYVLDSSFNPPTLAHLRMCRSALLNDRPAPSQSTSPSLSSKRLILLLATQNADKAPKPASFENRLVMMTLLAEDVLQSLSPENHHATPPRTQSPKPDTSANNPPPDSKETEDENRNEPQILAIDIAVTKHPFFIDKAFAIESVFTSPSPTFPVPQIHLTGYDTLIRLLDPKYYPPTHTLAPLVPLFTHHRLRVTYRTDSSWGKKREQDEYVAALGRGDREAEGGRAEWADRIEMVAGRKEGEGEGVVSSTAVRDAVQKGDGEALGGLVSAKVRAWVLEEGLYIEG